LKPGPSGFREPWPCDRINEACVSNNASSPFGRWREGFEFAGVEMAASLDTAFCANEDKVLAGAGHRQIQSCEEAKAGCNECSEEFDIHTAG